MKIVSTTLAGNNEHIIADALKSVVDWVDQCIVIDTGVTDLTLDVARQVAGDKLRVVKYIWQNDFSAARNFAISSAEASGADWAVTVDTDERLICNGPDVRAYLEQTSAELILAEYFDGHYRKERAFRLPTTGEYRGPTHEAFMGYKGPSEQAPELKFTELGKSREAAQAKFQRDIEILTRHTAEHPEDPRWWFYLGESHKNSGDLESAVMAYGSCWKLDGWDEESAWAAYRKAECLMGLGRPRAAIEACMEGVARHPGFGECFWYAGFISYRLGRYQKAILYSELALRMGWTENGIGKTFNRSGFKHVPGLVEGPLDVLHWSYRQLGQIEKADFYQKACNQLYTARTGIQKE
jgi:tetratricopeptide (TPR) repeat protein